MTTLVRHLADAAATERLGAELSLAAKAGVTILLSGDLGAGKTSLARAIIRALAGDDGLEVPSPTFTLVQTYDQGRIPAAHADLYRIGSPEEVHELGLDELSGSHLLIVEWPDRLPQPLPEDRLEIELVPEHGGRRAVLSGHGAWVRALSRLDSIAGFLPGTAWAGARRAFLEGDASFRRYERLYIGDRSAVLMDMPARPDGPIIKHGKSYSALAGLAENIRSVLAINAHLRGLGFSAPETFAFDSEEGLAIIEDFGSRVYGRMLSEGFDMREPMRAAVRVLARMAALTWPAAAAVPGGGQEHRLPAYDRNALQMEVELLLEWFWPFAKKEEASAELRDSFLAAWAPFLAAAEPQVPVWTLRDYHSPNLLWLPEREGDGRVGLIDTQDAVLGHPAYDVVSLLQDARVDVPESVSAPLLDYYCALRRAEGSFDEAEFRRAYAILGAQRATKILGIFARLSRRDGKHGYLRHVPRVSRYLEADLHHPDLAPLKAWYDRHLPRHVRDAAAP